jgi:hypothetical protein
MIDKLTKDQAIERYDNLCENALQAIDALPVKMLGVQASIEDMAGTDMSQRMINLVPAEVRLEIIALWNVREEICGNSAFIQIIEDETP